MATAASKIDSPISFASANGMYQFFQERIKTCDSHERLSILEDLLNLNALDIINRKNMMEKMGKTDDPQYIELIKQISTIQPISELIEARMKTVPEKNAHTFSELFAQGVLIAACSALILLTALSFLIPPLGIISAYLIVSFVVAFNVKTLIENHHSFNFKSLKDMINNPENVKLFLSLAASGELFFYTFGEGLFAAGVAISSVTIVFSVLSLATAYNVYKSNQQLKVEQKELKEKFETINRSENVSNLNDNSDLDLNEDTQAHFGRLLNTTNLDHLTLKEKELLKVALETITETKTVEACKTCLDQIQPILAKNPDLMMLIELKTHHLAQNKESVGELKKRVLSDTTMVILGMSLHLALFIPGASAVHFLFVALYVLGTASMSLFVYNEYKEMKQFHGGFKKGLTISSTSLVSMFACILWTTVLGATFTLNPLLIIPTLIVLAGSAYLYQRYAQQNQQAQVANQLEEKLAEVENRQVNNERLHPQEGKNSTDSATLCENEQSRPSKNITQQTNNKLNKQEDDSEGETDGESESESDNENPKLRR